MGSIGSPGQVPAMNSRTSQAPALLELWSALGWFVSLVLIDQSQCAVLVSIFIIFRSVTRIVVIIMNVSNDRASPFSSNKLQETCSIKLQQSVTQAYVSGIDSDHGNSYRFNESRPEDEDDSSDNDSGAESSDYAQSDSELIPMSSTIRQPTHLPEVSSKRKRDPENWSRNKSKKAVVSGQAGTSQAEYPIPEIVMGSGCLPTCRSKCRSKISYDDRKRLNREMRGLSKRDDQWKYMRELMEFHELPNAVKKKTRVTYFLISNGKKIKVCQTMFVHSFDKYSTKLDCFIVVVIVLDGR
ncbi:hypothetical protein QAD02_009896 [Eretmocerus hayati]|uniref:Uncharacterized protein n=1 Tax=Eretmocerus hayati TaxID=131215 RepID=A0ACC2NBB9_9HYME|nr:hypothetical protein QAD02_009896 [Eretmocerus hayati]